MARWYVEMPNFGKNVSLEAEVIQIVAGYQNKTRKTFSATLNIIIKQWDKLSVELERMQRQEIADKTNTHLNNLKNAEVERE